MRAVADLVVILNEVHAVGRFQGIGALAARLFFAGDGPELSLVHPAPVDDIRERRRRRPGGRVVAVLFAGQGHAHLVVKVVHPDAVQVVLGDQFRQVAVVLGQQQVESRPACALPAPVPEDVDSESSCMAGVASSRRPSKR